MRITIDKAGRIVIPKSIRERYRMYPGTVLELESETEGVLIKASEQDPALIHKQGVLVHHGSESVNIDTAEFVNRTRGSRDREIVAEKPEE